MNCLLKEDSILKLPLSPPPEQIRCCRSRCEALQFPAHAPKPWRQETALYWGKTHLSQSSLPSSPLPTFTWLPKTDPYQYSEKDKRSVGLAFQNPFRTRLGFTITASSCILWRRASSNPMTFASSFNCTSHAAVGTQEASCHVFSERPVQSPILKPTMATTRLPIKHSPELVVCVVSTWQLLTRALLCSW